MKARERWIGVALWVGAVALLLLAVRNVPMGEILQAVGELSGVEIAALLVANAGIMVLFGMRWRGILAAMGYDIPILAITRYRLASFGVSYFTPGPHFGGEPLQVIYLTRHHEVPGETATAAVTLDKLLEMMANFAFLLAGVLFLSAQGGLGGRLDWWSVLVAVIVLSVPCLYLLLLMLGMQPLSMGFGIAKIAESGDGWIFRVRKFVGGAEAQMSAFARKRPRAMAVAFGFSGLVWAAMIGEFWLLLRFLDVSTNISGLVTIIVAARFALLTPLPGALGALEAGQALALQSLGFDPAVGLGISLVIRGRDILFGLIGLIWGGILRGGL